MDSRDGNVQQNHPTLCRNGCGFYSAAGNEGLCSVCYKDLVKKKQAPPTNMPATLAPTPGSMASLSIEEGSNNSSPTNSFNTANNTAMNAAMSSNATAFGGATQVSAFGGAVGGSTSSGVNIGGGASGVQVSGGSATGGSSIETGSPTVPSVPEKVETAAEMAGAASGADGSDNGGEGKDGKKKKNRCLTCKKKVGLTGFTCRCGGLFCSIHRYSDKHVCGFDYKALGAEEISKSNPVVVAEKVAKI